jgi:hypothetical protein
MEKMNTPIPVFAHGRRSQEAKCTQVNADGFSTPRYKRNPTAEKKRNAPEYKVTPMVPTKTH